MGRFTGDSSTINRRIAGGHLQNHEETPSDVKFNIFKRINSGGLVLEPQEIRHALFQGVPAQFVHELANNEEFFASVTSSTGANLRRTSPYLADECGRQTGLYTCLPLPLPAKAGSVLSHPLLSP